MSKPEEERTDAEWFLYFERVQKGWVELATSGSDSISRLRDIRSRIEKKGVKVTSSKVTLARIFSIAHSAEDVLGADNPFLNGMYFVTSTLAITEQLHEEGKPTYAKSPSDQESIDKTIGLDFFAQATRKLAEGLTYAQLLDWMEEGVISGRFAPQVGTHLTEQTAPAHPFIREVFVRGIKCAAAIFKAVEPIAKTVVNSGDVPIA